MKGIDGVEFIIFEKSGPAAGIGAVRRQLAGRRFPLMFHMHPSMRANLAGRAIDARVRLGFDRARARDFQWLFTNRRIPARSRQHVMDGFFAFAEAVGIGTRTLRWDIPVSDEDARLAADYCAGDGPVCVISPCSSQRSRNYRNWPSEYFVELVHALRERYGARVIVTGGSTDIERQYARTLETAAAGILNLVGQTSLKQLFALISRADCVICPDSGPAHMATAAGTPVVGLYATSNRHRTGPYLSQHLVVDRYPEAVRRAFGKPVSELRWGRRVRDPAAMALIRPADVLEKVDEALCRD